MNRRNLLKLAGATALTAGMSGTAVAAPRSRRSTGRGIESVEGRGGARLFVRDWGAGSPMLFVAGWTLPSDFWGYQMVELAGAGFRTAAYDRRGHGRSADPGGGYDFDTLADDLANVIERLDLRGATLVGHSMAGGEIARYLARHGSRRVARVALVAPTTPFLMKTADNPAGVDRDTLAALRRPLTRDFPGWIDRNTAPFFTPGSSAAMIEWGKGMMIRTSLQAVVECARAMAETDFRADLARIDVPALVVHGDRDASAPLPITGRRTAELIPGARLSVYEGAPHGLPLTHMERLNAELIGFARS